MRTARARPTVRIAVRLMENLRNAPVGAWERIV
jgi:hypothetical protein